MAGGMEAELKPPQPTNDNESDNKVAARKKFTDCEFTWNPN
jgi:hypothetical protein